MAVEVVTTGRVKSGRLKVRVSPAFSHQLASMRDGPVTITVERKRATRSSQQNRMYWGVYVQALSEHTGYTPDEIHELLKAKFLPKKLAICDGNGEVVDEYVLGGSTRQLDVLEFGAYLDAVAAWALTLNCPLPELESEVA